jgi:hypothetical protein
MGLAADRLPAIAAPPAPIMARSTRRAVREGGARRFDYLLRLGDDALILGQRSANGAATRRRSRSTSASPTSRST